MSTLKTKQKKIAKTRQRRTHRVRNALASKGTMPRVSVTRSLKHISAQIIDDANHRTLASFSSTNLSGSTGDKKAIAKAVGAELCKKAKELSIDKVYFDRGRYLYHGRIAALADGLREGGLKF